MFYLKNEKNIKMIQNFQVFILIVMNLPEKNSYQCKQRKEDGFLINYVK
jgi:hypothetical protein